MAWRSSGKTNVELIRNLASNRIIASDAVTAVCPMSLPVYDGLHIWLDRRSGKWTEQTMCSTSVMRTRMHHSSYLYILAVSNGCSCMCSCSQDQSTTMSQYQLLTSSVVLCQLPSPTLRSPSLHSSSTATQQLCLNHFSNPEHACSMWAVEVDTHAPSSITWSPQPARTCAAKS